jgi:hypothetical protein
MTEQDRADLLGDVCLRSGSYGNPLLMWAIYSPLTRGDFDQYALWVCIVTHARFWMPDRPIALAEDLDAARALVPGGLRNIGRVDSDETGIVEMWI